MPGIIFDTDENEDRFTAGIMGAVVGKELTERFRAFAEAACHQLASKKHGGNLIFYNFGAAFLAGNRIQLDTALAVGANDQTPDWGWTAGLSVLFGP